MRRSAVAVMLMVVGCLSAGGVRAAEPNSSVLGTWKDEGGAIVRVLPCGADVCLRIVQLEPNPPGRVDAHNPDAALRSRSLCGLEIGHGFQVQGPDHAAGGSLYDPRSGNTYRGEMTSHGNILKLRGYIGIPLFGRTATWTRLPGEVQTCAS